MSGSFRVLDREIDELVIQTITLEQYLTSSLYGDYTYGPPRTLPCRIVGKQRMVRDVSGREVISTTQIHILGPNQPLIGPKDRITLPDPPYTPPLPTQPVIIAIDREPDELTDQLYQVLYT